MARAADSPASSAPDAPVSLMIRASTPNLTIENSYLDAGDFVALRYNGPGPTSLSIKSSTLIGVRNSLDYSWSTGPISVTDSVLDGPINTGAADATFTNCTDGDGNPINP